MSSSFIIVSHNRFLFVSQSWQQVTYHFMKGLHNTAVYLGHPHLCIQRMDSHPECCLVVRKNGGGVFILPRAETSLFMSLSGSVHGVALYFRGHGRWQCLPGKEHPFKVAPSSWWKHLFNSDTFTKKKRVQILHFLAYVLLLNTSGKE